MTTVYRCSDTITGIFSAVYELWQTRTPGAIQLKNETEQKLFCTYQELEETNHKALAVEAMIKRHLGYAAYWDIYHAALSFDPEKGNAIYDTIRAARELTDSTRIMEHLTNPQVFKVFSLSRNVGGEAHNLTGFIRFRELYNRILYAEITPKNQVLTCLAPHFADRFPRENWLIHDRNHHMFVVHEDGKQWVLVSDENVQLEQALQVSAAEDELQKLWQTFFSSISIASRENRRGQNNHLPLRYRGNMTEFVSK